ncbi:MAG TPA: DUF3450 family protein [Gammaproteobacteria bacterium]|nr:DUF3450 family protein [Gammaproteobacteria bacterium]
MVKFPYKASCSVLVGVSFLVLTPMANAQSNASPDVQYAALLQKISDTEVDVARQELFVVQQEREIKDLQGQLDRLDGLLKAVPTIVEKMTAALAEEVAADYPFDAELRANRMAALQERVADETAGIGDKYRKALNAYKIEINYGQSVEAYKGNHPITPTLREGDDRYEVDEKTGKIKVDEKTGRKIEKFDGNYLRYGRTAFVYINNDGTDPLRYDLKTKSWVKIPKSKAANIRRGVRVAVGEVAPSVIMAPVVPDS